MVRSKTFRILLILVFIAGSAAILWSYLSRAGLRSGGTLSTLLSSDITRKMIAVCEKNWLQGEHRCYCQKYIEYAPEDIRANSECE